MTRVAAWNTLAGAVLLDEDEIYRLSIDDVRRMYDAGILVDEDRVELIDGVLLAMNPPTPRHSAVVACLTRHFVRAYDDFEVRVQDGLKIVGGYVLPDLMVIDPIPPGADESPTTAHLVVEVSVTSQRRDRAKALRYARAGVAEYWLVDIPAQTVFVHWDARDTGYEVVLGRGVGSQLQPRIGGPPVPADELLR